MRVGVAVAVAMIMASLPVRMAMAVAAQNRHDAQVDNYSHKCQNEHHCAHHKHANHIPQKHPLSPVNYRYNEYGVTHVSQIQQVSLRRQVIQTGRACVQPVLS